MSDDKSFTAINDTSLVDFITNAKERIVFIAPGVSKAVAEALQLKWRELVENITVILDISAEVCRLGYGDIEGLTIMQQTALELGMPLCHEPDVRIGVLIVDNQTIVYSPTPLLIETQPDFDEASDKLERKPKPNAIIIGQRLEKIETEVGLGDRREEQRTIGLSAVKDQDVQAVTKDVDDNPPLRFDIARYQTVFNSKIEFVELKVEGCSVSRHTASIPPDLMGIARDSDAYERIRSSVKIVGENDTVDVSGNLSEKSIQNKRLAIEKKYLVSLKEFGKVILRSNRTDFETEIEELKAEVKAFSQGLKDSLNSIIKKNSDNLHSALLPAVKQSPPERWRSFLGPNPSDEQCSEQLRRDLEQAFGSADKIVKDMKVKLLFKGVTYDTLTDENFRKLAKEKLPGVIIMNEYDAAQGEKPGQQDLKMR